MQDQQLLAAATQFGTPLFVYDSEIITRQFHRLKKAFPTVKVKLNYAMKALSNTHILRLLLEEGVVCDAVSIEEVQIALRAGFLLHDNLFTPNCVG